MDSFLKLHKHKLKFLFLMFFLIGLGLRLIPMSYYWISEGHFLTNESFEDVILSTVVITLMLFGTTYLSWLEAKMFRKRSVERPPFDSLGKIGFSKTLVGENSKWSFTEETVSAVFNGFQIIFCVEMAKTNAYRFKALTKRRHLPKKELRRIKAKFHQFNIEVKFGVWSKCYSKKLPLSLTIDQLEKDLNEFTELLKSENFEPA